MLSPIGGIERDDMQRIDHMGPIFGINQKDYAPADSDEIRMRNIKTSAVGKSNFERAKIAPKTITNVLQIQHVH